LRARERGTDRKDSHGILIKPDMLLRGVVRADRLIDALCKETIKIESNY